MVVTLLVISGSGCFQPGSGYCLVICLTAPRKSNCFSSTCERLFLRLEHSIDWKSSIEIGKSDIVFNNWRDALSSLRADLALWRMTLRQKKQSNLVLR